MTIKLKKIIVFGSISLLLWVLFIQPVMAVDVCSEPGGMLKGMSKTCYCQGNCNFCDFTQVAANIIVTLRTISLIVMTGMIIFGGIMMMSAGASVKNYKAGWGTIKTAIIGFALAISISLILNTFLIIVSGSTNVNWKSFINGRLGCPEAIQKL